MAIIIGRSPKAEKQQPVAAPENKIKDNVEPVEVREENVVPSEETKVEEPVRKVPKKTKRNGKK